MGELQVKVYFPVWIPNKIAWFLEVLLLGAALPLGMASQINPTQINATLGQSVLLPCLLPPPPPPLKDIRVYWQTVVPVGDGQLDGERQPDLLHFFNKGAPELDLQALHYQNRTFIDPRQLAAGNFSLELKNVTEKDNQTIIHCLYSTEDVSTDEVSRYTLMLEKPVVSLDPDPHSLPAWATGVLVVLACVLLVCVAFCLVRKWKNANGRANRERANANGGANHERENANGGANHEKENANGRADHETENGAASGREREEVNGLLSEEAHIAHEEGRTRGVVSDTAL